MTNTNSAGEPPVLRLRSPHDVIAAVPYLLGFHPADSLVAIGSDGPQGTCAMRLDLPPGAHRPGHDPEQAARQVEEHVADAAEHLAGVLSRQRFRHAVLVGYGTRERVAPIMAAARAAIAAGGVEVLETLRVDGGRFWSGDCQVPSCCPPEGIPYDVSASPIAAQATVAGRVALPGREELARSVAPIGGPARRSMRQATDRAQRRFLRWLDECRGDTVLVQRRMVDEGLPYLRAVLARDDPPADDEVAWLGVLLTHLRVRDEAWVRTDIDRLELWRGVLCRVEEPFTAAPACLTAYAAYLAGDGALANVALDRAVAAVPGYSMAGLLRDMMLAGVPPARVRLRMTPEALADAWDNRHPTEADHKPG
jgi:hypothetical protein